MSRIKSKGTKPEVDFLKHLSAEVYPLGHRYRKHCGMGKPDIVFQGKKVAVFIDGCFWHGCKKHSRAPLTNVGYWRQKIEKNQERDKKIVKLYKKMGWTSLRFWEHQVKKEPTKAVKRVLSFL